MRDPKYIAYDDGMIDNVLIFANHIDHAKMAEMLPRGSVILGAGHVCILKDQGASCYGRSVGLGIESRGSEDSEIANKMLNLDWWTKS